jgi:DNA-binding response OmpR family regulator
MAEGPKGAGERTAVLLEDNLMFGMMVEPALRHAGYSVVTLGGGDRLADRILESAPALVVVNLTSTRFSGAEVIRELRRRNAAVPVLGYAGHVEREFFAAGRDAGADLVVPNSAMRKALPEVLAKLQRVRGGEPADEEWPE